MVRINSSFGPSTRALTIRVPSSAGLSELEKTRFSAIRKEFPLSAKYKYTVDCFKDDGIVAGSFESIRLSADAFPIKRKEMIQSAPPLRIAIAANSGRLKAVIGLSP